MRTEVAHILTALQFLTRLPVPGPDRPDLSRAARYFPLVGLLIGGLAGLVFWLLSALGLPSFPAAGVAVATQLLLTGGLHEDGLADLADGLGGGATRDRALEIMRDSRIGAYGAMAIVMSLLLRTSALAILSPIAAIAALAVSLALGRFFVAMTLATLPYARPQGLASGAAAAGGPMTYAVAGGTVLLAVLVLGGWAGLAAAAVATIGWIFMCWRLMRRLGGYTGDGLGAIEQVVSTLALLTFAAAWT